MYVCICNAITDHKIKEAVAAGASSLTANAIAGNKTTISGIRVEQ